VNDQVAVVVDASTARRGGGLTVAYELVRRLPNWPNINWQIFASPELAQTLDNVPMSNVKFHIAFDTRFSTIRHFRRWLDLGTLIKATNADAVMYLGSYGFHVGCVPSIVVVQLDLDNISYASSFRSYLTRRLVKGRIRHSVLNADGVVAVSNHVADQLVARLGCDSSLIRIVPLSGQMDLTDVKNAPPKYVLDWMPYVFAVSGAQDYKNIQTLLDAAHLLGERSVCSTRLVIAGVDEATAYRQGYRYDSSVIWAGRIPRSELVYVYQNAEMYVHHSMTESFALPILEAIYCNTLAIVTAASWARNMYQNVIPMFQPNASDLAALMRYYLENDSVRKKMIGRQRVFGDRFTWDAMAEGLVESIMKVTDEHRQR
jgi:glycosyltransferase involved in cell wall biosynthesis